jgi:competence protein ComEA
MSTFKCLLATLLLLAGLAAGAAEPINLNSADAETLANAMVGIGPAKAAAIVAYRDQHGPFKSVDDLLLVKGIGEATLDQNRERLTAATP